MRDVFSRLYRTKAILSCLLLVGSGIALLVVARALEDATGWLALIPLGELGGILVGAGVLGVLVDAYLSGEQAELDDLRLRTLLHEHAPAMRDAVLEAFAANHADLKRVATPEMLDNLIANSLALRLGDEQFASEIYTDIRDQAIRATERWHDATLSIDLKPLSMDRGAASRSTPAAATRQFFTVTVRWEYLTVPHHAERRFVCLSDRDEYAELVHERDATSAWYLRPDSGLDASSQEAFELLRFAVNGEERPIRRSARKHAQTYTANLGTDHVKAGEPVKVSYTYRTITSQTGHLLFFDIEQPTRDLHIDFDFTGCGIANLSTLDLVPSVRPTRIERPLVDVPGSSVVRVDLDGWIFPRSGVAFVWTLEREAAKHQRQAA